MAAGETIDLGQNEINENTEKLLFAEDFMAYVMSLSGHYEFQPWRAERFRPFVYNAYMDEMNDAISYMVCCLRSKILEAFNIMREANCVNLEGFRDFSKPFLRQLLDEGFEPKNFLCYCTAVSTMAVHFYQHSVRSAPDEAVFAIVRGLRHNIDGKGWSVLHQTVKWCAHMYELMASDTPSSQDEDD